jgi:16S rRNA (guanine(966)-N(2))-methyltransferase RsmD
MEHFFMNIIAGTARRTALVAPDGIHTRPTACRMRENIFNIIAPRVRDSVFLDLFAGSGAMGIEALSRGATSATFVENAPAAIKAIRANLAKTRLEARAHIITQSVEQALGQLKGFFDIIFLDPPYEDIWWQKTLTALTHTRLLAEKGLLIAECPHDAPLPETVFALTDTRRYGKTKFLLYGVNQH